MEYESERAERGKKWLPSYGQLHLSYLPVWRSVLLSPMRVMFVAKVNLSGANMELATLAKQIGEQTVTITHAMCSAPSGAAGKHTESVYNLSEPGLPAPGQVTCAVQR